MTSLLQPFIEETNTTTLKDANHNIRHRQHRNVLKSKENLYKHKCKKVLKRKLKKYKLRQDGKEDQDIIDVSDTLLSSLFIRSPNKVNEGVALDQLRPKNYLFRMVKRKHISLTGTKSSKSSDVMVKSFNENEALQISPTSQEKKQTNAFKLLMESRNKSLGTNSPGKDKPLDETETQELIEKKSIKAKRNLILQRMAEEKGSLKKKEVDEQHEKYINKKMEKRAERLKTMIKNNEPKTVKDEKQKQSSQIVRSPLDSIDTETNGKIVDKPIKTLQLVSMFTETMENKIKHEKLIPKEDEEFLKKLSPSLRKKESMLSYFKKVDKDSDSAPPDSENDNVIIKVKLGTKPKKKIRKKKLSLNRHKRSSCEAPEQDIVSNELEVKAIIVNEVIELEREETHLDEKNVSEDYIKERRKRKREAKERAPSSDIPITNGSNNTDDLRPRRIVKKPVKYSDDVVLTSSDEELLIFTPKKKKHVDDINNSDPTKNAEKDIKSVQEKSKPVKKIAFNKSEKIPRKEKKPTKDPPKPVKLAPLFTKSKPDLAAIQAKQKFLQSGVPDQLKKLICKQKDSNTVSNSFPQVVHVQQLDKCFPAPPDFDLKGEICYEEINLIKSQDGLLKILTTSDLSTSQCPISMHSKNNVSTQTVLQNLKESYPRFPVYRTYKLLRGKKKGEFKNSNLFSNLDNSVEILNCSIDMQNDNPDQLTWSEKYKPLSGKEIIGNFESIKEMKKWLVSWTENDTKAKVSNTNDSDSSDYYQSDPDSRDSMKSNNNLLILSGPVGTGKTSCVYAVAAELSIKVIEVNASSKRNGKIMMQDLQEATQSHKVNRATGSTENSQKSQELIEPPPEIKVKKRGRPKKVTEQATPKKLITKEKPDITSGLSASQESTRTAMSLILIDDADIVFDQDDGFCSAIMQLVQSSKRPVILITGSLSLPHLQRFLQGSKILEIQPLSPNMLGTWLDLMCLADSGMCWPGLGAKFLNFFKGDMRKTINCLQFYVGSQEQGLSTDGNTQIDTENSDIMKFNADDENSCMSWVDRNGCDDKNIHDACDSFSQSVWDTFVNEHIHLTHMKYSLKMFNVWWSVPKILNIETCLDSKTRTDNIDKSNKILKSLESISNVLDSISICDYYGHIRPEIEANMTSHPWYDAECNSVSELENLDDYDRKYDINNEISCEIMKISITTAQENMGFENRFELDFPEMTTKRCRDRIVSRHNNLTACLSLQSTLDRKALALDYWSSCRTICRLEKSKTDTSSKRNNRFCHYLKSLSVLCKSDSFDRLANSLNPNGHS